MLWRATLSPSRTHGSSSGCVWSFSFCSQPMYQVTFTNCQINWDDHCPLSWPRLFTLLFFVFWQIQNLNSNERDEKCTTRAISLYHLMRERQRRRAGSDGKNRQTRETAMSCQNEFSKCFVEFIIRNESKWSERDFAMPEFTQSHSQFSWVPCTISLISLFSCRSVLVAHSH